MLTCIIQVHFEHVYACAALPHVVHQSTAVRGHWFGVTQVQALQQVLSAGRGGPNGQHAGRQARRRTTSYKSYRHVRRPNAKLRQAAGTGQNNPDAADIKAAEAAAAAAPDGGGDAAAVAERPTSRAMRRRPGRLRAAAERSCATDVAAAGQLGRSRRLETHVWHAKRMSMQERWVAVLLVTLNCTGVTLGTKSGSNRRTRCTSS